jgi:hypothetical protein
MLKKPSPFRVQKYLAGLRYPAHRDQAVQRARERGADEDIVNMLLGLPDRPYESPVSLSCEVGRQVERASLRRAA